VASAAPLFRATSVSETGTRPRPPRRLLGRFWRNRVAMTGLVIVAVIAVITVFAPLIAPHDPDKQFRGRILESPSQEFPLGTDHLGRDLLSRVAYGARPSIGMASLAILIIVSIAIVIGAWAGYVGGLVDDLAMRVVDVVLAFPGLVLTLAIVGILGPSLMTVIIGVTVVSWAGEARLVRGLVLEVRERGFVEAAVAIGASRRHIVLRHVIPNIISPIIVLASLEMGAIILSIAGLNFLGLGIQPPTAEWGAMLNQGRPFFQWAPELMLYPGIMITLTVLGLNLLGDGLRDVFDPRYSK